MFNRISRWMTNSRKRSLNKSWTAERLLLEDHAIESLESRQLLAGNVMATLTNDFLQIAGDTDNNRIELVSDGTTITVRGRGTTLNGANSDLTFLVADVNFTTIVMGAGNDRVTMKARNTDGVGFGPIDVVLGMGNDRVTLRAENAGGVGFDNDSAAMVIDPAAGNDRISIIAANTGGTGFRSGDLIVAGSQDTERLMMRARNRDGTGFDTAEIRAQLGGGRDRVTMIAQNSGVGDGFTTNDSNISLEMGEDTDRVVIRNLQSGSFNVGAGTVTFDGGAGDRDRLINSVFATANELNFEIVI